MVYISNESGYYFSIHKDVWNLLDSDYLQRAGCYIHETKELMYEFVAKWHNISVDEVSGSEVIISVDESGNFYECDSQCNKTLIEVTDVYDLCDWLNIYKL